MSSTLGFWYRGLSVGGYGSAWSRGGRLGWCFWREQVVVKPRKKWQVERWAEAMNEY
jgi:hypothetical protein